MRAAMVSAAILLMTATAAPQEAPAFVDVPPWHWAADAVRSAAAARVFQGYPTSDAESAVNSIIQIYGSFAHARQPEARAWSERFLTNLPANWPQPLEKSSLTEYR